MLQSKFTVFPCATTLFFLACGSGPYENDPLNWRRVFGENPPAGITIVYSYYHQNKRWTDEREFRFELEAPDSLKNSLIRNMNKEDAGKTMGLWNQENAKGDTDATVLDVYSYPSGNPAYKVFIHKISKRIFIVDQ